MRNSLFNGLGTALIVPFNFIALFTLARRLGAASLGTFFTLFAIAAVIHWMADAGTTTVLTRRVARNRQDLATIVPEALGVLLGVCCVSSALFMAIAVPWMKFQDGSVSYSVLGVAALAMASRHVLDFAACIFRGLERFEFENLARVIQTGLFCVFIWFFVWPHTGDLLAAYLAYAASNWIAALLLWTILIVTERCGGFRVGRSILKAWWGESLPLGVGDVIRQVLLQLDTLMLALFRPPTTVGLFSVAARPLQPLQLVPRIIVSVTFPEMSRSGRVDRTAVSRTFAQTTTLLTAASLPVIIMTTVAAEGLIRRTAGPEFVNAVGPLRLLIWATVLIFVNAQLRLVLTALDQERHYWRLISRVLIAKIVFGVTLIPLLGIYGGCLANLLAEGALCAGGLFVMSRLGIVGPAWGQILRLAPASAVMTAFALAMIDANSSLVRIGVVSIAALAVYVAVCLATGVWPREDVKRVWDAASKFRTSVVQDAGRLQPSSEAGEKSAV